MQDITTAEAWRAAGREAAAKEAVTLSLPSGVKIQARRPGPAWMASAGRLPVGLAAIASGDAGGAQGLEDARDTALFFRDLLEYCVVSPRISLGGEPGTILPSHIPDRDVSFLIAWALRGEEAARLATFRRESGAGDGGDGGEDVRAATERAAGDRGSVSGAKRRSGRAHGRG